MRWWWNLLRVPTTTTLEEIGGRAKCSRCGAKPLSVSAYDHDTRGSRPSGEVRPGEEVKDDQLMKVVARFGQL